MPSNKRSVPTGDDDYNVTYYEDSIDKLVERVHGVDRQLKDANRKVSGNLTVLILVLVCLISVVLVNQVHTSNTNKTYDLHSKAGFCNLTMKEKITTNP